MVRNPFSRLVSFFENKVRLGEPGYRHLEARYGNPSRFGGLRESFSAFCQEVVAEGVFRRGDYHLQSQTELIMPRFIPYTHIFRLEASDEAVAALHTHLNGSGFPDVELARNRGMGRDWRGYYDAHSAGIVARAYAEDFAEFAYDPADWRADGGAPQNSAQDEYWRAELVARNAMIDQLYTHLGVPPATNPAELLIKKSGKTI
jgi:hypothetical protein